MHFSGKNNKFGIHIIILVISEASLEASYWWILSNGNTFMINVSVTLVRCGLIGNQLYCFRHTRVLQIDTDTKKKQREVCRRDNKCWIYCKHVSLLYHWVISAWMLYDTYVRVSCLPYQAFRFYYVSTFRFRMFRSFLQKQWRYMHVIICRFSYVCVVYIVWVFMRAWRAPKIRFAFRLVHSARIPLLARTLNCLATHL